MFPRFEEFWNFLMAEKLVGISGDFD